MAKRKKNKVAEVVTYIILLLLLFALLGGVLYLTRGATQNFKTFSIKIGERYILRDEDNLLIPSGEQFVVNSASDYSVAVYAYAEYDDFKFQLDGKTVLWSDFAEVDFLTLSDSGLRINKQADGFTLDYVSLSSIVSTEKQVEISSEVLTSHVDRLRLVVTSNGSEISIRFRLFHDVGTVELSPNGNIVF